ncbi:UvrD-helicase domain-containing protein [Herbaspirillum sp. alder98]|uniref:UvrD-helicase domain-containing protein n=1 Tax=Herbaspirillum sp. alder98 TaxID=2913096 RepID=UPI001CD8297A|nr:UvrD-helicase domain-containing protein [Herbaspirillum sp. alder98]MCA1325119.1 UvrD-helicase domain-containing protein [Herbaspirillum sp. alder98]
MRPSATPYEINDVAADAASFTRAACDPHHSVVVEACAGSGKTWLLVGRMLRLLLAGAQAPELLAITFTRKAAQEMRERLMELLHELALASDAHAAQLLRERGVAEPDLARLLPLARGLYERILASEQSLSIDTFHSWFARLLQIAPLAAGVPHGYALTEKNGELQDEAYRRFMQSLRRGDAAPVKAALLELYELAGDFNARSLLDAFLDKRAEWWASTLGDDASAGDDELMREPAPLRWLQEMCGDDALADARLGLWRDGHLVQRLGEVARLLGQGSQANQTRAVAIETALSEGASAEAFSRLFNQFFDDKDKRRKNGKVKALLAALAKVDARGDELALAAFEDEFNALGDALAELQQRSFEKLVLQLNRALFTAGRAYLDCYQEVKAEQRVFDFADLEWHAYRLLNDEASAAYLQTRLDARYSHILLDEFQDTNPLQWSIVRAWLQAYGGDTQQPTVFVVGDPKQSIYRFRRAEPRVFVAAREMLRAQGAVVLRANQTRRNATAVVELLNQSFLQGGNVLYARQSTLGLEGGEVWKLPLARVEDPAAQEEPDTQDAPEEAVIAWRNPLTTPREEQEDARRKREGEALARALLLARNEVRVVDGGEGRALRWSDVMLLVRKRTHLAAYESALREAGIAFVSDRRGGLLESLEIADLIALLTFLITPNDTRALAHVLKSPIIGAVDEDLIQIARRDRDDAGHWWQRMLAMRDDGSASAAIVRAVQLLHRWLQAAPHLPVHDLLDMILHQGQLVARYAQHAAPTTRSQTLGNIAAFVELSLNMDAGRYPSLPKFIDALRVLARSGGGDAPDEASVDASADAVRILTVHSAKGLEAPVVALLDANHSDGIEDHVGILCDWPQERDAPVHFSAFGRRAERGRARHNLFEAEERFRLQEDWNLLYVAVTRAKQLLLVSGVAGTRGAATDGVQEGSWYQRLFSTSAPVREIDALQIAGEAGESPAERFELALFDPAPQPPSLFGMADMEDDDALMVAEDGTLVANAAIDEGVALHALLERVTHGGRWPPQLPKAALLAPWLGIDSGLAAVVHEQATRLLAQPELERFFNPALHRAARNEMEIVTPGGVLRCDRVVMFDDEVWVLDYKRRLLDSERADYAAQLARYRAALVSVYSDKQIRSALITADGRLWEQ